jgi:cytochrome c oxidase subunit II
MEIFKVMPEGEMKVRIAKRFYPLMMIVGFSGAWAVACPSDLSQADQNPHVIEISAKKYEFSPTEIRVNKGEKVELNVHSIDEMHGVKLDVYPEGSKDKGTPGLAFAEPSENGKVTKGKDQVLDFTAQEVGTYDFKCAKVCGLGHDKMKGKLMVEP